MELRKRKQMPVVRDQRVKNRQLGVGINSCIPIVDITAADFVRLAGIPVNRHNYIMLIDVGRARNGNQPNWNRHAAYSNRWRVSYRSGSQVLLRSTPRLVLLIPGSDAIVA